MAAAVTTTGTTIGSDSTATSTALPRKLPRKMPTAATVPSSVASAAVAMPTTKLFRVASSHLLLVKKSSYQRHEYPGAGSVRSSLDENDSGNTTTIGAIRKTRTTTVVARSSSRVGLAASPAPALTA